MSRKAVEVRRRTWARGGAAALILASLTLVLSGCSASSWERDLRFGWPTGVTKQAERMRVLWTWAGVAALVLGILVWGLIFWCCIVYRKRKTTGDTIPRQTKYNLLIELTSLVVPIVVIAVLFWRTVVVENYVNQVSAHPDVVVEVDAFKWNWQFQYHTMKDEQTNQSVATVYSGAKNISVADAEKPGSAQPNSPTYVGTVGSDNEIPILVIPVDQTVFFIEHSEDVIHSFWVPEFLFKRDVIPYGTPEQEAQSGLVDNHFQITPTQVGSYVGRCAELCGTYHSQMNFEVRVVPKDTFAKYIAALQQIGPNDPARQSKALAAAGFSGKALYATTTYPFNTSRTNNGPSEK